MPTPTPHVSIEELSRLLDGELSPRERADLETRMKRDPLAVALLARMREITGRIAGAILTQPDAPAPAGTACVQEDTLLALADGRLPEAEERRIEPHILACPACLRRVLEALRTATAMRRGRFPALPDAVREDVRFRALLHVKERTPPPTVGTLVLVLNAGESVEGVFGLEAGYRMRVSLRAMDAEVARGDISVSWTEKPKGGVEFSLVERGTGRKIFRGLTDPRGEVLVKRIRAGCYDAHVPAGNLTVELRIEADT